MEQITAPWTPDQAAKLNQFQQIGGMHPFTCGSPLHIYHSPTLIAREDGWHCPEPACGYRQNWAHAFMANPEQWPKPFRNHHGSTLEAVQPVTAEAFKERLVQTLAAEAYECDGVNCGMTEQACWDAHNLRWTATSNGVVHLDGSTTAIADVAVRVARELGLLPKE